MLKRGEEDNYELLVSYIREHQEEIYRFAYRYMQNRENTLDVVQEAVLKALMKIGKLKNSEYMKTWFYRILINESMDFLRRNRRIVPDGREYAEEGGEYEKQIVNSLTLNQAVDELPVRLKTVILLRFYQEMKIGEIAQILKISENTVKTRLYKGLKELRLILGEE